MNKNVKTLRNIEDGKKNIIINFIFIILIIVPNIFNVYLASKSINEMSYNISEYFTNQLLYYIKNIVTIFIVVNLYSFNQIKEYKYFYYLPISVDEFYIFFIQQYKNKFIIITITNLLTFIITTINLKLSSFILIFNILLLSIITIIAYYTVNVFLSFLLLNIPLKLYTKIIKILLTLSFSINTIPSTNLKIVSKYIEEYIFTESFSLLVLLIVVVLLFLFVIALKNIKVKLLKEIFERSIKAEEQSRKYDGYKHIDKLKFTTPLRAYINNEVLLIKKGYFKLLNGLLTTVVIYSTLVPFIGALSDTKLNDKLITFSIIYSISLFVDIIIVNYSLNSISFMDDFIEWIKATCLDELLYYRAKLVVKCIFNAIIFIIIIVSLYFILPIIKISNDEMFTQSMVCCFNIFIITYFDNNLDFRYQIFSRDTNIKVYIPKIKKFITFLFGKIVIIAIQLLIFLYLLKNIYAAILFSYLLLSVIIYLFRENLFIRIPTKRPKKKEKYISIDDLI